MSVLQETLFDALNWAKISELPSKYTARSKKIWIAAIAMVTKVNNSQNYAVVFNDGYGNPVIKKDFGKIAIIKNVDEIYPYDFLMEADKPILNDQESIVNYLVNRGFDRGEIEQLVSETKADGTDKDAEERKADLVKVKAHTDACMVKDALKFRGHEKRGVKEFHRSANGDYTK